MSDATCISMRDFEAALNRCMAAQPSTGNVLSGEVRKFAEVYGLCIHARVAEVDLTLYPAQAEVVRKWLL